jgi:hypothetical protein
MLCHAVVFWGAPRAALPRAVAAVPRAEGYSPLFRDALSRFDAGAVPRRAVPANGTFALFLLVRNVSILGPLIRGSPGLFARAHFDEVLVFNEEGLSGRGAAEGVAVRFVDVAGLWAAYPPGFDPARAQSRWVIRGRKWGYHQMIRFFWRSVFLLPETQGVARFMRLDGDSCLAGVAPAPRAAFARGVVYLHNRMLDDPPGVSRNLGAFVADYANYFRIEIRNRAAWNRAFRAGSAHGFYNNLELMDVRFWMRPEVQHFVHFVDCSWGIYLYRWGDAILRYLALAMFASDEMVRPCPESWVYTHPCRRN